MNIGEKPPNPGIEGPFDPGWNVVTLEYSDSKSKITFYLNGEEVGEVDKNQDVKSRYLYITPDPYTSHYAGTIAIEYVELTGPTLQVEPLGKFASTWGEIKNRY